MINLRRLSLVPLALALLGCGQGANREHGAPASSGSASAGAAGSTTPASSSIASAATPATGASAVPLEPATPASMPVTYLGAKNEKACKAQTIELGNYQDHGDVMLGGNDEGVAAAWRVRLPNKPHEQVAFASFDKEGRPVARARGVGLTLQNVPPRVFASGSEWTVVWFDEKGLAFARPRVDKLPQPEISHLGAVGPEVAADFALAASPVGAVLAAAPFGLGKAQLGIFLFAPADNVATVKALGMTHNGKEPHRSAVAAGPGGIFVVWDEAGALLGSHFDAAGKENDAPCAIAPAGVKRSRLGLAATGAGAVAMWMEEDRVRTRALDATGCPTSPIWTVAEGRWASIAALGETAVVAWAAADGRLLAARLQPNAAPPGHGIDAAEGSAGIKDPPSVIAFGGGRAAFGWSEQMTPAIRTKRMLMRIIDAACIP